MKNVQEKKEYLRGLLQDALECLAVEIEKEAGGGDSLDDMNTLVHIRKELRIMKCINDRGFIEKDDDFCPSLATPVVDRWPMENPLGNNLCEIESLFKKLYKNR